MPSQKSACQALRPWLRPRFGSLAALTGTDARALDAAVHIVELMAVAGKTAELCSAFGVVVAQMQEKTRPFAYDAIAHVLDWSDCPEVWRRADLHGPGMMDPAKLLSGQEARTALCRAAAPEGF